VQRPTDQECEDLVNRFDVTGDGELELFEWLELAATLFLGKDDQEIPTEMFKLLADGASGRITAESLYTAASRLLARSKTSDFAAEDALSMVSAIAAEVDGISSEEFLQLCADTGYYNPDES
jgi:Ca2+-binding EF-hand superfamily protein